MKQSYSGKWGADFASILKKFEQGSKIGAVTGKVVGLSPLSVSIMSGAAVINSKNHNIFLSEKLDKKQVSCCSTCENWIPTGSHSGNLCPSWEPLKNGDTVLIIPNETEKVFYIVDRMIRK